MKKAGLALVIGLLIFALITDPAGLADGTTTFLGWLKDGAVAIITFVKSLFK